MKTELPLWTAIKSSLLLGFCLGSTQTSFAGDITTFDSLGFQAASQVINSAPMGSPWSSDVFLHRQNHIELQPNQDGMFHGDLMRYGLNLRYNLRPKTDLAVGVRAQAESLQHDEAAEGYWNSSSKRGGNLSLALRQSILDQGGAHLALLPYIEPGLGPSDSFSMVSKSRIGLIVSTGLDYRYWDLTGNFGYRYRPVEYYGPYRLGSDFHMSARLGIKFKPFSLHGEIHERNLFVLSSQARKPAYEIFVSQHHKLIASLTYDDLSFSLFWGRAIRNKTFGMPGQELGLSMSWDFGAEAAPVVRPIEPIERKQVQPPPLEQGEPFELIEPESESEYPLDRLDEIEHTLMKMQLVEDSGHIPSIHERELYELQLGEAMIRQLRQVDQVLEERRQIEKIRSKMQEQSRQASEEEPSNTNPALLELLDQRAKEDMKTTPAAGLDD